MSEQGQYLVYFVEHYAARKGMNGAEVFALLDEHDLLTYICQMYYTYHTECVENAIDDIDRRLNR